MAPLRSKTRKPGAQRGTASVETAITSLLFLATLLPIFDLSRALYRVGSLQHATRAATRFATTGGTTADPGGGGQLSREASIIAMVKDLAGIDTLESAAIAITSEAVDGTPGVGAGGPSEFVTVNVTYDVELFTPMMEALFTGGVYRVSTSATFLNENFAEGA